MESKNESQASSSTEVQVLPLINAMFLYNYDEFVQLLEDGADPNEVCPRMNDTVFMCAILMGRPLYIYELLEYGADWYKAHKGDTALQLALLSEDKIVQNIAFKTINKLDSSDESQASSANVPRLPLIDAMLSNDFDIFEQRLEDGANPNEVCPHTNITSLMCAIFMNHTPYIRMLLIHGAEWDKEYNGRTARSIALSSENKKVKKLILKSTHNKLKAILGLLGFENEDGCCFGITMRWLEYCLLGRGARFEDKIDRYVKCPLEKIKRQILNRSTTSIHAFFQPIELYQNPGRYPELFGEELWQVRDYLKVAKIVALKGIQDEGGLQEVYKEELVYSLQSLTFYLEQMRIIFDSNLKIQFAISIGNPTHQIGIMYYPDYKEWCLMDINIGQECNYKSEQEISNKILRILGDTEKSVAVLDSYILMVKEQWHPKISEAFLNSGREKRIDIMLSEELAHTSRELINIFLKERDIISIQKLLKLYPVSDPISFYEKNIPILFHFVYSLDVELVKLLIDCGFKPGVLIVYDKIPETIPLLRLMLLFSSDCEAKAEVVSFIRYYSAIQDIRDMKSQALVIMQLWLDHGASLEFQGKSLIDTAVEMDCDEMVCGLLRQHQQKREQQELKDLSLEDGSFCCMM